MKTNVNIVVIAIIAFIISIVLLVIVKEEKEVIRTETKVDTIVIRDTIRQKIFIKKKVTDIDTVIVNGISHEVAKIDTTISDSSSTVRVRASYDERDNKFGLDIDIDTKKEKFIVEKTKTIDLRRPKKTRIAQILFLRGSNTSEYVLSFGAEIIDNIKVIGSISLLDYNSFNINNRTTQFGLGLVYNF